VITLRVVARSRVDGLRRAALLALGLTTLPHVAALARTASEGALCCPMRSCCCPPKAAPVACHDSETTPSAGMRCHHARAEATVPLVPALVTPRLVAWVSPTRSPAPAVARFAPRLGFDRVESPPPRDLLAT
jgi:hypothetical protein